MTRDDLIKTRNEITRLAALSNDGDANLKALVTKVIEAVFELTLDTKRIADALEKIANRI